MAYAQFHPPGYRSKSVAVSQVFAQHLAKWSNCNVVIQHNVAHEVSTAFRLICTQCGQQKPLSMETLHLCSTDKMKLDQLASIQEFAMAHVHRVPVVAVPVTTLRKFREE